MIYKSINCLGDNNVVSFGTLNPGFCFRVLKDKDSSSRDLQGSFKWYTGGGSTSLEMSNEWPIANKLIPINYDLKNFMSSVPGIITFSFYNLLIYAVPVTPPGTDEELLGHFKVIYYQMTDNKLVPKSKRAEVAALYAELANSLIFDVYMILSSMSIVGGKLEDDIKQYYNENKIIPLVKKQTFKYILNIHCPMNNVFKVINRGEIVRCHWSKDDYTVMNEQLMMPIYQALTKNIRGIKDYQELPDQRITLNKTGHHPNYYMDDDNKDIKQNEAYNLLYYWDKTNKTFSWQTVKDAYDINYVVTKEFNYVNESLREKERKLFYNLKTYAPSNMIIPFIISDFQSIINPSFSSGRFTKEISVRLTDFPLSVAGWTFNFTMPIYFYYGEDLAEHLKQGIQHYESVIGPYTFELNDNLYKLIKISGEEDYEQKVLIVKSIFQIYFLILLLSMQDGTIVVTNLNNVTLNSVVYDTKVEANLNKLLEKLFNSEPNKAAKYENIYYLDDIVVFDPVVNKIIALTNMYNGNTLNVVNEMNLLGIKDLYLVMEHMMMYNIRFKAFIYNLFDSKDALDPYLTNYNE